MKRAARRQGTSLLYGTALLFVAMSGRTAWVHGARSIFMGVNEARAANEQRRLTATSTPCPTPEPTTFADTGGEGFLWKDALVPEPYSEAGSKGSAARARARRLPPTPRPLPTPSARSPQSRHASFASLTRTILRVSSAAPPHPRLARAAA